MSQFGEEGGGRGAEGGERREPDGQSALPLPRKAPCVNKDSNLGEAA